MSIKSKSYYKKNASPDYIIAVTGVINGDVFFTVKSFHRKQHSWGVEDQRAFPSMFTKLSEIEILLYT